MVSSRVAVGCGGTYYLLNGSLACGSGPLELPPPPHTSLPPPALPPPTPPPPSRAFTLQTSGARTIEQYRVVASEHTRSYGPVFFLLKQRGRMSASALLSLQKGCGLWTQSCDFQGPSLPTETLKWLSSLPILMQESFWW